MSDPEREPADESLCGMCQTEPAADLELCPLSGEMREEELRMCNCCPSCREICGCDR